MASIFKRKNSENWYYSITYQGKHYQGSTKTSDRQSAKLIAEAIQTDIAREKHDLPSLKQTVAKKFATVYKEYLNSLSTNVKSTTKNKEFAFNHFLPVFGEKDIKEITRLDIQNYQMQRRIEIISKPKNSGKRDSEISYAWLNKEINILSNFFNFCIAREIVDKNPATGVKKLNTLSRLKTLSDSDIEKLINGATNKLTQDLITFLIYTGCRKGEALNLKWDDVDLQNGVIAIKGTKTKYDRHIPISNALRSILNGIEKNQDSLYVFNRNGAKLTDFKRSFHTACRNAGLKDLHIHDLRHVFASKMVMGGTSLYITGELLGHRTTQMTKRYSHLVPETLRKAVNDVFSK
ncbi:MAG: tyrosine-type recombinase/integrase [bacterium]